MSLEANIKALTEAVQQLTAVMQASAAGSASVPQPAAPVQQVAAPNAMPPLPTFAPTPPAPAPAQAAPAQPAPAAACPFSDAQGLMQYTMAAYQAMGPEKGARIQGVLQSLGHSNINDIKPEQYGQFHAAVEALKAA